MARPLLTHREYPMELAVTLTIWAAVFAAMNRGYLD